jgi:aerobic-type carbon monoxide dehydrogenase small subunit (CoxS/CutS family)
MIYRGRFDNPVNMTVKKERKKGTSLNHAGKTDLNEGASGGVANAKVSRRTLLKGTATAAAMVGVSAVSLQGLKLEPSREQSSSSTTSTTTTTKIQTNTGSVGASPPILATSPDSFRTITLTINNTAYTVDVEPRSMLVDVIRDTIGLIATKRPCNRMECGACTVLIDGIPHESCSVLAIRAVGHSITTSEISAKDPVVNALQQAWVTADGGQCGYCGPGYIMAATALLKANPGAVPTEQQIKAACSGNLCRCGNYMHILAAIQLAATNLAGGA